VISVYDNTAPAANAGEDVYICSPTESITLAANAAIFPGFGTWNITSAQGANGPLTSGTFADINDPLTTISGLEIGIYTLTWTISNGPCGNTTDTMIIQVNDPASPNSSAGPDQWFCENLTDATMAGNVPLFPAVGTWTAISFDPTGTVVDANNPTTEISNIPLNEHLFVWTIDNGACANGITSDTISVYVNDITIASAFAGLDESFCGAPDSLIMTASVAVGLAEGYWTYNDDVFDFTDSTFHNSIVYGFPLGVTTFTWTVDNGACGISSDDVTFTVYDPELPVAYAGENEIICDHDFTPFNLNATAVDPPATAWWTVLEGPIELGDTTMADSYVSTIGEIIVPLIDIGNVIMWTVDNGKCGTTTDTISFILEDCLTIEIPDAFSPNGDGVNDIFFIPNLESYPNHSLKIFNRWGTQVFEAAPYLNDWDGKSYHTITIGEDLPVSTYYYILDLGNGENAFTGFVYLKR
jgi:gliding motility-associated-like protein